MADVSTETPEVVEKKSEPQIQKAKTKEQLILEKFFDPESTFIDPNRKYVFEAVANNQQREMPVYEIVNKRQTVVPHKDKKPFQNLVFTSQIVWNGNRRMIRYYDGCTSIFMDEQPKEKELVDQLRKSTVKRGFVDGKFGCFGDEKMLLFYLTICSWNINSEFRTRSASPVFMALDQAFVANQKKAKIELTEKALKWAKEATKSKMLIHADYLGVPVVDWDSGNPLEESEIRAEYRSYALQNPDRFCESYNNKELESKYYIDKAIREGVISNKPNPNKVAWSTSNREVCDISGLKSSEAISQRVFEFSQTDEGKEFLIQLKSVMEEK